MIRKKPQWINQGKVGKSTDMRHLMRDYVMLLIIIVFGTLLDWIPILYITLPVFIPIVEQMGWDSRWFALLIVVCLQSSWLTPPFGFALFFLRGIAPPGVIYFDFVKGCFPYMLCQLVGLGLLILFPQIILFLPNLVLP